MKYSRKHCIKVCDLNWHLFSTELYLNFLEFSRVSNLLHVPMLISHANHF